MASKAPLAALLLVALVVCGELRHGAALPPLPWLDWPPPPSSSSSAAAAAAQATSSTMDGGAAMIKGAASAAATTAHTNRVATSTAMDLPTDSNPPQANMAEERTDAEEACRRAEKLFLGGDITGACRLARMAQRTSPSHSGLSSALAAYDVHAAAAVGGPDYPDWRAVLGVGRSASRDAVKKQFRRLSLLVHPDKNRSAAAEGAFKLLRRACDALLSACGHHDPANAAAARDWYWRMHAERRQYPARKAPTAGAYTASSRPRAAEPPRQQIHVRCEKCGLGAQVDLLDVMEGTRCLRCRRPLSHPWSREANHGAHHAHPMPNKEESAATPPWPKPPTFPCPAQCPQCATQFTSMVSAGTWKLQCKACKKLVMVDVHGPDAAAFVGERPRTS